MPRRTARCGGFGRLWRLVAACRQVWLPTAISGLPTSAADRALRWDPGYICGGLQHIGPGCFFKASSCAARRIPEQLAAAHELFIDRGRAEVGGLCLTSGRYWPRQWNIDSSTPG